MWPHTVFLACGFPPFISPRPQLQGCSHHADPTACVYLTPHLSPILVRLFLQARSPTRENHPSLSSRLTLEVLEDFLSFCLLSLESVQYYSLLKWVSPLWGCGFPKDSGHAVIIFVSPEANPVHVS